MTWEKAQKILEVVIVLAAMVAGYVRLEDKVNFIEDNRNRDANYFKESMLEIKQDVKEIQRDLKRELKENKNK
jgi:hypothetical protein